MWGQEVPSFFFFNGRNTSIMLTGRYGVYAQVEGLALVGGRESTCTQSQVGGSMQQWDFKFRSHCLGFLGEVVISPQLNVRMMEKVLKV